MLYLWLKAFHIIAVTAWMAGLFYLPRLFVYHSDVAPGSATSETFKIMERRLLRAIMLPAMIVSWALGLALAYETGVFSDWPLWFVGKAACVVALTGFQIWLAALVSRFAADERPANARFFRMINEIPTLLLIAIVLLAVLKPL
ncbi:MAG: protoporphyrinogen oxidase HemJ [Parvibaculaceae bacterium]